MSTVHYLDLSYEGRQVAERNQLDNGKLPHGAYRGSRKHPPSHLSYDKGREFKEKVDAEVSRLMEQEELHLQGESPSWALLVHREPSYTDESPLFVQNYMAASKHAKFNVTVPNRQSLLPNKSNQPLKYNGTTYYRPNRMHQYLTATELKNCSEDNVDVKYGRPTRTTLLRARQRSTSASTNSYDQRREFYQRVDDIKSNCSISPSTEYLQLRSLREGESLHSYLTGARYNRAHCLDAKSVEHSGVYMPRQNPAYGMFFRGPKGQEYLQEFETSTTPTPVVFTPPNSSRRRPVTAPTAYHRRPATAQRHEVKATRRTHARSNGDLNRAKEPKLNVVGCGLNLGMGKELYVRLSRRPETARASLDRRVPLEETYRVNQPPPTPTDAPKTSLIPEHDTVEISVNGMDDRGADSGDKENRLVAQVDIPNDAQGDVQESVAGETEDGKDVDVKEDVKLVEDTAQDVANEEDQVFEEQVEGQESQEVDGAAPESEIKETSEETEEAENIENNDNNEVLDEQAKELVEEVLEKAEEEVKEDEKQEEKEEGGNEGEEEGEKEVAEEQEEEEVVEEEEEIEKTKEDGTEKTTKEVRFFITEEGTEPKQEKGEDEDTGEEKTEESAS